MMKHVVI